jgi:hypothetical protein
VPSAVEHSLAYRKRQFVLPRFAVLVFVVLMSPLPHSQGQAAVIQKSLSLSLEVVRAEIPAGTVPQFRLKIRNISGIAQKVLDIPNRHDLQHSFCELDVFKDGKLVLVPSAFSDFGEIEDKDFISLQPGESVTFTLSRFADAWNELPPGKYRAYVHFYPNPEAPYSPILVSPGVQFVVRP